MADEAGVSEASQEAKFQVETKEAAFQHAHEYGDKLLRIEAENSAINKKEMGNDAQPELEQACSAIMGGDIDSVPHEQTNQETVSAVTQVIIDGVQGEILEKTLLILQISSGEISNNSSIGTNEKNLIEKENCKAVEDKDSKIEFKNEMKETTGLLLEPQTGDLTRINKIYRSLEQSSSECVEKVYKDATNNMKLSIEENLRDVELPQEIQDTHTSAKKLESGERNTEDDISEAIKRTEKHHEEETFVTNEIARDKSFSENIETADENQKEYNQQDYKETDRTESLGHHGKKSELYVSEHDVMPVREEIEKKDSVEPLVSVHEDPTLSSTYATSSTMEDIQKEHGTSEVLIDEENGQLEAEIIKSQDRKYSEKLSNNKNLDDDRSKVSSLLNTDTSCNQMDEKDGPLVCNREDVKVSQNDSSSTSEGKTENQNTVESWIIRESQQSDEKPQHQIPEIISDYVSASSTDRMETDGMENDEHNNNDERMVISENNVASSEGKHTKLEDIRYDHSVCIPEEKDASELFKSNTAIHDQYLEIASSAISTRNVSQHEAINEKKSTYYCEIGSEVAQENQMNMAGEVRNSEDAGEASEVSVFFNSKEDDKGHLLEKNKDILVVLEPIAEKNSSGEQETELIEAGLAQKNAVSNKSCENIDAPLLASEEDSCRSGSKNLSDQEDCADSPMKSENQKHETRNSLDRIGNDTSGENQSAFIAQENEDKCFENINDETSKIKSNESTECLNDNVESNSLTLKESSITEGLEGEDNCSTDTQLLCDTITPNEVEKNTEENCQQYSVKQDELTNGCHDKLDRNMELGTTERDPTQVINRQDENEKSLVIEEQKDIQTGYMAHKLSSHPRTQKNSTDSTETSDTFIKVSEDFEENKGGINFENKLVQEENIPKKSKEISLQKEKEGQSLDEVLGATTLNNQVQDVTTTDWINDAQNMCPNIDPPTHETVASSSIFRVTDEGKIKNKKTEVANQGDITISDQQIEENVIKRKQKDEEIDALEEEDQTSDMKNDESIAMTVDLPDNHESIEQRDYELPEAEMQGKDFLHEKYFHPGIQKDDIKGNEIRSQLFDISEKVGGAKSTYSEKDHVQEKSLQKNSDEISLPEEKERPLLKEAEADIMSSTEDADLTKLIKEGETTQLPYEMIAHSSLIIELSEANLQNDATKKAEKNDITIFDKSYEENLDEGEPRVEEAVLYAPRASKTNFFDEEAQTSNMKNDEKITMNADLLDNNKSSEKRSHDLPEAELQREDTIDEKNFHPGIENDVIKYSEIRGQIVKVSQEVEEDAQSSAMSEMGEENLQHDETMKTDKSGITVSDKSTKEEPGDDNTKGEDKDEVLISNINYDKRETAIIDSLHIQESVEQIVDELQEVDVQREGVAHEEKAHPDLQRGGTDTEIGVSLLKVPEDIEKNVESACFGKKRLREEYLQKNTEEITLKVMNERNISGEEEADVLLNTEDSIKTKFINEVEKTNDKNKQLAYNTVAHSSFFSEKSEINEHSNEAEEKYEDDIEPGNEASKTVGMEMEAPISYSKIEESESMIVDLQHYKESIKQTDVKLQEAYVQGEEMAHEDTFHSGTPNEGSEHGKIGDPDVKVSEDIGGNVDSTSFKEVLTQDEDLQENPKEIFLEVEEEFIKGNMEEEPCVSDRDYNESTKMTHDLPHNQELFEQTGYSEISTQNGDVDHKRYSHYSVIKEDSNGSKDVEENLESENLETDLVEDNNLTRNLKEIFLEEENEGKLCGEEATYIMLNTQDTKATDSIREIENTEKRLYETTVSPSKEMNEENSQNEERNNAEKCYVTLYDEQVKDKESRDEEEFQTDALEKEDRNSNIEYDESTGMTDDLPNSNVSAAQVSSRIPETEEETANDRNFHPSTQKADTHICEIESLICNSKGFTESVERSSEKEQLKEGCHCNMPEKTALKEEKERLLLQETRANVPHAQKLDKCILELEAQLSDKNDEEYIGLTVDLPDSSKSASQVCDELPIIKPESPDHSSQTLPEYQQHDTLHGGINDEQGKITEGDDHECGKICHQYDKIILEPEDTDITKPGNDKRERKHKDLFEKANTELTNASKSGDERWNIIKDQISFEEEKVGLDNDDQTCKLDLEQQEVSRTLDLNEQDISQPHDDVFNKKVADLPVIHTLFTNAINAVNQDKEVSGSTVLKDENDEKAYLKGQLVSMIPEEGLEFKEQTRTLEREPETPFYEVNKARDEDDIKNSMETDKSNEVNISNLTSEFADDEEKTKKEMDQANEEEQSNESSKDATSGSLMQQNVLETTKKESVLEREYSNRKEETTNEFLPAELEKYSFKTNKLGEKEKIFKTESFTNQKENGKELSSKKLEEHLFRTSEFPKVFENINSEKHIVQNEADQSNKPSFLDGEVGTLDSADENFETKFWMEPEKIKLSEDHETHGEAEKYSKNKSEELDGAYQKQLDAIKQSHDTNNNNRDEDDRKESSDSAFLLGTVTLTSQVGNSSLGVKEPLDCNISTRESPECENDEKDKSSMCDIDKQKAILLKVHMGFDKTDSRKKNEKAVIVQETSDLSFQKSTIEAVKDNNASEIQNSEIEHETVGYHCREEFSSACTLEPDASSEKVISLQHACQVVKFEAEAKVDPVITDLSDDEESDIKINDVVPTINMDEYVHETLGSSETVNIAAKENNNKEDSLHAPVLEKVDQRQHVLEKKHEMDLSEQTEAIGDREEIDPAEKQSPQQIQQNYALNDPSDSTTLLMPIISSHTERDMMERDNVESSGDNIDIDGEKIRKIEVARDSPEPNKQITEVKFAYNIIENSESTNGLKPNNPIGETIEEAEDKETHITTVELVSMPEFSLESTDEAKIGELRDKIEKVFASLGPETQEDITRKNIGDKAVATEEKLDTGLTQNSDIAGSKDLNVGDRSLEAEDAKCEEKPYNDVSNLDAANESAEETIVAEVSCKLQKITNPISTNKGIVVEGNKLDSDQIDSRKGTVAASAGISTEDDLDVDDLLQKIKTPDSKDSNEYTTTEFSVTQSDKLDSFTGSLVTQETSEENVKEETVKQEEAEITKASSGALNEDIISGPVISNEKIKQNMKPENTDFEEILREKQDEKHGSDEEEKGMHLEDKNFSILQITGNLVDNKVNYNKFKGEEDKDISAHYQPEIRISCENVFVEELHPVMLPHNLEVDVYKEEVEKYLVPSSTVKILVEPDMEVSTDSDDTRGIIKEQYHENKVMLENNKTGVPGMKTKIDNEEVKDDNLASSEGNLTTMGMEKREEMLKSKNEERENNNLAFFRTMKEPDKETTSEEPNRQGLDAMPHEGIHDLSREILKSKDEEELQTSIKSQPQTNESYIDNVSEQLENKIGQFSDFMPHKPIDHLNTTRKEGAVKITRKEALHEQSELEIRLPNSETDDITDAAKLKDGVSESRFKGILNGEVPEEIMHLEAGEALAKYTNIVSEEQVREGAELCKDKINYDSSQRRSIALVPAEEAHPLEQGEDQSKCADHKTVQADTSRDERQQTCNDELPVSQFLMDRILQQYVINDAEALEFKDAVENQSLKIVKNETIIYKHEETNDFIPQNLTKEDVSLPDDSLEGQDEHVNLPDPVIEEKLYDISDKSEGQFKELPDEQFGKDVGSSAMGKIYEYASISKEEIIQSERRMNYGECKDTDADTEMPEDSLTEKTATETTDTVCEEDPAREGPECPSKEQQFEKIAGPSEMQELNIDVENKDILCSFEVHQNDNTEKPALKIGDQDFATGAKESVSEDLTIEVAPHHDANVQEETAIMVTLPKSERPEMIDSSPFGAIISIEENLQREQNSGYPKEIHGIVDMPKISSPQNMIPARTEPVWATKTQSFISPKVTEQNIHYLKKEGPAETHIQEHGESSKDVPSFIMEEENSKAQDENFTEQVTEDHGREIPLTAKTKEAELNSSHKKNHNILSGVRSKVKHSISTVKKAITCTYHVPPE